MNAGSPEGPWITFLSAGREYALAVHDVVEVLSARPATPIPTAVDRLAGIVSWRGSTLPVLDLPSALKSADRAPDVEKRMLVVRHPSPFAIRVDEPGRILHPRDVTELVVEGGDAEREAREHGIRLMRTASGLVRVVDPARALGSGPLTSGTERKQEEAR